MKYSILNQFKAKAFFCAVVFCFAVVFSLFSAGEAQATYGLSEDFTQVKTADNSAVYYLDHNRGLKKSYINAEAYLSYGNKWDDIKIVSTAELNRWPNFYLAKTADNPAVFYIQGNRKAVIANEQEFLAHNFRWSDIIVVSAVDLAGYVDAGLDSIYVAGNLHASSLSENGSLKISAGDTKTNNNQIPLGSVNNLVALFNFQAGDEVVEINKIKLTLEGLFTENMISRVYLVVDNNFNREYRGQVSGKVVDFSLNDKIFISPNSIRQFKFYIDTEYTNQEVSNNNIKITLPEIGSVGANATISGNFPLESIQYELVYAEGYLGKVKAVETSLHRNLDIFVGNSNQELANFNISETSGAEDVLISYLVFKNTGTAREADLANFVLKDKNNHKIAQAEKMSGNEIIFSLGNYKIKSLNYANFRVFGDIVSGIEKTINLELADIKVIGARTGYGLCAETINSSENLQIKRKSISVTAKDLNSKNSFAGQEGTLLGLFELSNAGAGADLENIKVAITRGQNTPALLKPVRMVDYETGVVFDTVNPTADGILEFRISRNSLSSGKKILLGFICEIPETTKQGDVYQVIIDSINYESGRDYYSDKIEVAGKQLVVSKSNIYVYGTKEIEEDLSFTKGQDKIKIAKFYVEASYGDDALITSLTFSKGGSTQAISYENGFSDLKLYINSRKIGGTISHPSGETYEFNNFSYRVKAGERATIYLYADTDNDLKIKELQLKLTNLVAVSHTSGVESTISGLSADSYQVFFHEAKAEILSLSGGSTSASQAGSLAASFKIKNTGNEDLSLNYITLITTKNGFSQSLGYKNLTIREIASNKSIGKVSRPVSGANKIKLNYTIPAGEEKTFQVYVDAEKNLPQETFELYFLDLIARGKESDIYANIVGDPTDSVLVNSQGTAFNYYQNDNIERSENNSATNNSYSFVLPVAGGYVSYGFGADSGDGYRFGVHNGIDLVVPQKTKVYAAAGGVVSYVFNGAYTDAASYVEIDHQNGFVTRYGHLYTINVKIGDRVEQGELIGLSGGEPNTYGAGVNTTGAHLHFDMTLNGKFVDPEKYL